MGRAERRRRQRNMPAGPLPHTGTADQLAGARWAQRDADSLVFYTMPWPVWLSAGFMVAIGVWVALSAWAERNAFGLAGVIFFIFAGWIARKAPRERTVLQREPGELRVVEGLPFMRTRRVVPFAEIDGFALEYNRASDVFRAVAVVGDVRVPVGRSFVTAVEAEQRIAAIADWVGVGGPPVDRRISEDEEDEDDEE